MHKIPIRKQISYLHIYTIFYKREYREMKENGRSKHKDINYMLHNTMLTI